MIEDWKEIKRMKRSTNEESRKEIDKCTETQRARQTKTKTETYSNNITYKDRDRACNMCVHQHSL